MQAICLRVFHVFFIDNYRSPILLRLRLRSIETNNIMINLLIFFSFLSFEFMSLDIAILVNAKVFSSFDNWILMILTRMYKCLNNRITANHFTRKHCPLLRHCSCFISLGNGYKAFSMIILNGFSLNRNLSICH